MGKSHGPAEFFEVFREAASEHKLKGAKPVKKEPEAPEEQAPDLATELSRPEPEQEPPHGIPHLTALPEDGGIIQIRRGSAIMGGAALIILLLIAYCVGVNEGQRRALRAQKPGRPQAGKGTSGEQPGPAPERATPEPVGAGGAPPEGGRRERFALQIFSYGRSRSEWNMQRAVEMVDQLNSEPALVEHGIRTSWRTRSVDGLVVVIGPFASSEVARTFIPVVERLEYEGKKVFQGSYPIPWE